jgi:hypothetical protein
MERCRPGVNSTGELARRRRLERFDLVSDRAADQAALTDVAGVGPAAEPGRYVARFGEVEQYPERCVPAD